MDYKNEEPDQDRRGFLKCMAWVGTGAMWTMTSGVLKGMPIEQAAHGAMRMSGAGGLRFVQISDSHIGFNKDANNDVIGTLRVAVAKIKAAAEPPSFVLHTGDLTHLSKPEEFDTLQQVLERSVAAGVLRARRARRAQRRWQELSGSGSARTPRAPAGTASIRAASTSSAWSTS